MVSMISPTLPGGQSLQMAIGFPTLLARLTIACRQFSPGTARLIEEPRRKLKGDGTLELSDERGDTASARGAIQLVPTVP